MQDKIFYDFFNNEIKKDSLLIVPSKEGKLKVCRVCYFNETTVVVTHHSAKNGIKHRILSKNCVVLAGSDLLWYKLKENIK